MTRENAKKLLPIIQAWADGKELQVHNGGGWERLHDSPDFSLNAQYYRIKPEPREFWLVKRVATAPFYETWNTNPDGTGATAEVIHVREVT